jgi:murein L,D-transpeptidase YcbB/YkuD
LDAPIPVYVSYFTAWPDDSGTVQYYGDVYGRDAQLAKAIAATEAVRRGAEPNEG